MEGPRRHSMHVGAGRLYPAAGYQPILGRARQPTDLTGGGGGGAVGQRVGNARALAGAGSTWAASRRAATILATLATSNAL